MNKNEIWDLVASHLKNAVPVDDFRTWFSKVNLNFLDPRLAVIEVPNKFVAAWLREAFLDHLADSFEKVTGARPDIDFSFPIAASRKNYNNSNTDHFININSNKTFESFIKIKSNNFAVCSAVEVVNNLGNTYNPLYFFSGSGVGKTHLLHAIGNKIKSTRPYVKIGYTSADRFSSCLAEAPSGEDPDTIRRHTDLDVLLFDDVDSLNDQDLSQKEFISVFDSLYQAGKQIVVAARMPPGQVKTFLPGCRSRLEWGVLSEIGVPDIQDKMVFIGKKIRPLGMRIAEDACFFLANNAQDLKELDRIILRLKLFRPDNQQELDLCTIENLFRILTNTYISVNSIKLAISQYFNISNSDLLSNNKNHKHVYCRHIAMYLTRKMMKLNYSDIAKHFNKKDHSTIINAIIKIDKNKFTDKKLSRDLFNLESLLFPDDII